LAGNIGPVCKYTRLLCGQNMSLVSQGVRRGGLVESRDGSFPEIIGLFCGKYTACLRNMNGSFAEYEGLFCGICIWYPKVTVLEAMSVLLQ